MHYSTGTRRKISTPLYVYTFNIGLTAVRKLHCEYDISRADQLSPLLFATIDIGEYHNNSIVITTENGHWRLPRVPIKPLILRFFIVFIIFQTSYYHIANSITAAERPPRGRNPVGKYRDNTAGEVDSTIDTNIIIIK